VSVSLFPFLLVCAFRLPVAVCLSVCLARPALSAHGLCRLGAQGVVGMIPVPLMLLMAYQNERDKGALMALMTGEATRLTSGKQDATAYGTSSTA
jgi:hypothetical protein